MRFDKILKTDGSRLCFKNLLIPKKHEEPYKTHESKRNELPKSAKKQITCPVSVIRGLYNHHLINHMNRL